MTDNGVRRFEKMTEFFIVLCSFIHSGDLYSASSRDYYSEALPAQPRTKKKDLRDVKFGRVGHQHGTQLKGEIIPC